jgi:hypothetical protein
LAIEGGLTLSVDAEGARLDVGGAHCGVAAPMLERRWYELRIVAANGRLQLHQTTLQRSWGVADSGTAEMAGSIGAIDNLAFGAGFTATPGPHHNPRHAFFNGRLEDPAILVGARDSDAPLDPATTDCVAWWDFSADIPTDRLTDRGHALTAQANLPTWRCGAPAGAARQPITRRGSMRQSIFTRMISTIVAGK